VRLEEEEEEDEEEEEEESVGRSIKICAINGTGIAIYAKAISQ